MVMIVPTGVDTTTFRRLDRGEARDRLGWPDRATVLFNAGFDPRRKRLDLAEAAVGVARREIPDLRLEVTRGEIAPEEMPFWMNAADVLLITSDSEGSPTVVHEAMACGLPIVSVDVGDVADRLKGSEPSAIVERSPEALARPVVAIVRLQRRSNGPELVRSLSQDVLAQDVLCVYRKALGGGWPRY
jgi:glycosyltransferase involved in cell wall biosynthesis